MRPLLTAGALQTSDGDHSDDVDSKPWNRWQIMEVVLDLTVCISFYVAKPVIGSCGCRFHSRVCCTVYHWRHLLGRQINSATPS